VTARATIGACIPLQACFLNREAMTSEDHFSCGVFLGMMVDFIEEFCIWVGKGTYNGLTFLIGSSVYIDEVHLDMRRLCALAVWSGRLFAFWRYGKKESA